MSSVLIPAASPPATSLDAARATLASLQSALAAMPERQDVLNTDRALTAHDNRQRSLDLLIPTIRRALTNLPALRKHHDAIAAWIEQLTLWRGEFVSRLEALPAQSMESTREDEHERSSLNLSIKNCDLGAEYFNSRASLGRALRERIVATYPPQWGATPDPWEVGFGPLPIARERLVTAAADLAEAQQSLEHAMASAQSLLAPPATT